MLCFALSTAEAHAQVCLPPLCVGPVDFPLVPSPPVELPGALEVRRHAVAGVGMERRHPLERLERLVVTADAAGARALLGELVQVQPARPEAIQLLALLR
ncbi:MAG TPA: hypothetical protein VIX73_05120 [Kofleriaceae bacterium]|jgi:hypothetical protein